jgi:predicted secreted hydrolase
MSPAPPREHSALQHGPRPTALAVAVTLAGVALGACTEPRRDEASARLSLLETLAGADTVGFARALEPRPFGFPLDHGPHPEFRTEWWYVTGNLASDDGRDFGFQLTIFRSALSPHLPATESAWGTNQAYMAHFALTDVAGGRFHAFERFARGAAGLAGASTEPFRVWLEDWTIESARVEAVGAQGRADAVARSDAFPLRLRAEQEGVALDLVLERGKPVVLQGDRGLSRKGPEPGNASYYYSHTRMPARGTLSAGSDTVSVRGLTWLDREWSTSALGEGQVGWDWFALQLSDEWDLMIYRLRRADGSADPLSAGVLVDPSGASTPLDATVAAAIESTGTWASPVNGALYPSGWRVRVPSRGWDLEVEPRIRTQELDLAFRYWEGAVSVRGRGEGGAQVTGRGYVELTGYAGDRPERRGAAGR